MVLARIGVPFIQLYAKLSNEDPLYTHESLDILVNSSQHISNAKAKKELGYTTRPLEESLGDTFAWYKQNEIIS
jgi:dihydroflavonol-4-reductase